MDLAIVIAVVVVALVFDYTNGFHDAANAIATSVSTRALTPRIALAHGGGHELRRRPPRPGGRPHGRATSINPPDGNHGLVIVLAGLLGAIAWNLITWYFGLPSSSSHALIGGLVGAALAAGATVHWPTIVRQGRSSRWCVSPLVGFAARLRADARDHVDLPAAQPAQGQPRLPDGPDRVGRRDGARPRPAGRPEDDGRDLPGAAHRRLRRRPATRCRCGSSSPRPPRSRSAPTPVAGGSCAPSAAGSSTSTRPAASPPSRSARRVLYTTAFVFQAPISTTHTITSAIMGAGATKRFSAVRWGVARSILIAWVPTFPAAASVGSTGVRSSDVRLPAALIWLGAAVQLSGIRSRQPTWIRSGSLIGRWPRRSGHRRTAEVARLPDDPVRVSPASTR